MCACADVPQRCRQYRTSLVCSYPHITSHATALDNCRRLRFHTRGRKERYHAVSRTSMPSQRQLSFTKSPVPFLLSHPANPSSYICTYSRECPYKQALLELPALPHHNKRQPLTTPPARDPAWKNPGPLREKQDVNQAVSFIL